MVNNAGAPIEVFWIDTFLNDGTIVKQTSKPLRNSSDTSINSYSGHQFVARFLHDVPGVEAYFTKGPNEETVVISYDKDSLSVLRNGVSVLNNVTSASTYFKLEPGGNQFQLTGSSISDDAYATVSYYSGWSLS